MRTETATNQEGSSHFPEAQEGGQGGREPEEALTSGEGAHSP